MKRSNAIAHVRQLCALDLGGPAVMPAVLRSLRQVVPCDSAAFFWVDDDGHITNMYAERMLAPTAMRRYFEHHYDAAEIAFRTRFRERSASGAWVVQVDAVAELKGTEYYEEVLKPLGADRILQGIVRRDGRPLGQVSLYRSAARPRFSPTDREALSGLLRYLAHAVTMTPPAASQQTDFRDSGEDALAVCASDATIEVASPRCFALLAHAAGETLSRRAFGGALDRALHALLRRTAVMLCGDGAEGGNPAEFVTECEWGRYRLRGYPLGDGRFGVLVQRQEHLLVSIADAMLALPLSAQQREAALLVARGFSNQQIATRMGVSINTASYHVKQLFAKLDVHDRAEAIATILEVQTTQH